MSALSIPIEPGVGSWVTWRNVPSRGVIASPKKTLSSWGNWAVPFWVPGTFFLTWVNEVCTIADTGGMRSSRSDWRRPLSPAWTVWSPVSVYPFSLNMRPKGVCWGKEVWQGVQARPVGGEGGGDGQGEQSQPQEPTECTHRPLRCGSRLLGVGWVRPWAPDRRVPGRS